MQLAAELGLRVHKLHKRYPGVCAQARRQKGVQFGCRRCRYQLDGVKLACANSAEAAHQKKQVPDSIYVKLTMCCPLGTETDVFWNLLKRFLGFSRVPGGKK